jgi:hypothetical protein
MQNSKKPKIALQRSLWNLDGSKRSSTCYYGTIHKTKYFQIFFIEFDQQKERGSISDEIGPLDKFDFSYVNLPHKVLEIVY